MNDVFGALLGGVHFDTTRFKNDINTFRADSGKHASTSAPAPMAAPVTNNKTVEASVSNKKTDKKKRAKRRRQGAAASSAHVPVDGIDLFSGGGGSRKQHVQTAQDDASPLPAATHPVTRTRDPFEEANVLRKQHRIRVAGGLPPKPLKSFDELGGRLGVPKGVLANVLREGYLEPTPIQRQAIPALLEGHELFAIAPTGSGKTLAFLVPLLALARAATRSASPLPGPAGVVLSPTRELASQSHRVLTRLAAGTGVKACLLSKAAALGADFSKVHALTATPLLLARLLKRGRVDLSGCRLLVLDEADRLFEAGLLPQVDKALAAATHSQLVRALFSATLPEQVEDAARSLLRQPLRVTVGERGAAAASVAQRLVFVGQEKGRLLALRQMLAGGLRPPVLVFVGSQARAREVHRELLYEGVRVDSIHAGQAAEQRKAAVDNFRQGRSWVLVATDLMGRGMDFVGVRTVVNYDFPRTLADYVHRVGRTGRAGAAGEAVTLYAEEDKPRLRSVANAVKASGGEVPSWMLQLKRERHRKGRRQASLLDDEDYGTDEAVEGKGTKQGKHAPTLAVRGKPARKRKHAHVADSEGALAGEGMAAGADREKQLRRKTKMLKTKSGNNASR